jgi:YD repeat-containing protein
LSIVNCQLNATYDKVGNRLSETNGRGFKSDYTYDALNRQTSIRDPYQIAAPNDPDNLPTRTKFFDTPAAVGAVALELGISSENIGKVVQTTDAYGHSQYVVYDKFGRQIATYDATKHRTSATKYDGVNRVTDATDTFAKTTTYSYAADNLHQTTTTPTGVTLVETFDAAGRTTQADETGAGVSSEFKRVNRR